MKPAPFSYYRTRSVPETVALLSRDTRSTGRDRWPTTATRPTSPLADHGEADHGDGANSWPAGRAWSR